MFIKDPLYIPILAVGQLAAIPSSISGLCSVEACREAPVVVDTAVERASRPILFVVWLGFFRGLGN